MLIERAEAYLAHEIMTEFANASDKSNEMFLQFNEVLNDYNDLVESLKDLPDEKMVILVKLMGSFGEFIPKFTNHRNDIVSFQSFISNKTQALVDK